MSQHLLFVDTETSGLLNRDVSLAHPSQPHIVQLAAYLAVWEPQTMTATHVASVNAIVRPDGWRIDEGARRVHGITEERANALGEPLDEVLTRLISLARIADDDGPGSLLVAHNTSFDHQMILRDCHFANIDPTTINFLTPFCTMRALTHRMKLPSFRRGSYKWPKLDEAYQFCFGRDMNEGDKHTAMGDLLAAKDIYEHGRREEWW